MQSFETEEEMKEYGKYFGKQEIEEVLLNGKRTFLCGTALAFTDDTESVAEQALKSVAKIFGLDKELADLIELDVESVSKMRDYLLEMIEEALNIEIKTVYDFY